MKESNEFTATPEEDASYQIEAGKKYSIIVQYPKGKLFAQLFAEDGETLLVNKSYSGKGPLSTAVEGETDENGILEHLDVPLDDYQFTVDGHETVIPAIPRNDTVPHNQVIAGYRVENNPDEEETEEADEDEDNEELDIIGEARAAAEKRGLPLPGPWF